MLRHLRNGVPIEVPENHAYEFFFSAPILRVGDEATIVTSAGYLVEVQLLRGPGRKRYLVDVKGLKRWLRADAEREITSMLKQRELT